MVIRDEYNRVSVLLRVERWADGSEHVVFGGVFDFGQVPAEARRRRSRVDAEVIGTNQVDTFFNAIHDVAAFDVTA